MTIRHFYHIYADGLWETPVEEHVNALKSSGLEYCLSKFYIGLVGNNDNRNKVVEKLKAYDLNFSVIAEQDSGWEQVTMNKMHDLIKNENGWVFYAHTKGAHDPSPINIAWRKSMTYYNIIRWRDKVEPHLNNIDIDTIGCHWCNNQFWGGTYWWARTDYLKSLSPPMMNDRWDAERWIGSGNPRIVDLNPGWPAFERFTTLW